MAVGSGDELSEQMEQTLRAIMRNADRQERQMDATRLVRGLPSRRVMAAIKFIQEVPTSPGRDQVLGCFLESWAAEDGRRAVVFAASLASVSERELAIRAVLRGWSKTQPAEAWSWVIEQAGATRRAQRWREVIVTSMSNADRPTTFNLLERLPDSEFRDRMAMVVMDQILENENPREAITWLGEFPESARHMAAARLARTWAASEPQAAASWLTQAYPREVDGLGEVLGQWAYSDPSSAAEWAWQNFSGENRRVLLDVISAEWVGNDGPSPLAEWLNTHDPDPSLDGAIGNLALSTANFDPATALVWAQSIFDADTRSMLEIMIGRQWIRLAPDEAAANLPVLLQSDSARAALLEPVEETYYAEEDTGEVTGEVPLEEVVPPVQ